MKPTAWGSHYWFVIHVTAKKYPRTPTQEDKQAYKHFYEELWRFLPCKICSDHYQGHLKEIPIDAYLEGPERLFEWTVILHNRVNVSKNKQVMPLRDAIEHYNFPDGKAYDKNECTTDINTTPHLINVFMVINVITIALVVLVLLYLFIHYKLKR